jgi:DNA repair exonuclease SbcCD nuclease subunit
MRFMHIADIHLGYQQYGLQARFDDFSKVFLHLIEEAINRQVDVVFIGGDLFEKRTVEPLAMRVAVAGLAQLREAGIPALAVEGNHEKAYYREQTSWMDFLDALDYVKLLNPTFKEGRAILTPHDEEGGAYVDLDEGVRVYGLKYYGASTGKAVKGLADAIAAPDHDRSGVRYTVVLMHAGLEGQLAHVGRLKPGDAALLRDHVDYLALGHIHKPYEVDGWIYNPGSPETCSLEETAWRERGCYIVEVTPDHNPKHAVTVVRPQRRPFHRCRRLEVDGLMTPNAVYDAVRALIRQETPLVPASPRPVVELTLSGMLPFNRYDLDLDYIQSLLDEAWSPLMTRVRNVTTPAEFEIRLDEESSRPELERTILRELLERDARFRDQSEGWTEGALDLKRMVLQGSAPEAVIDHLRRLRIEVGTVAAAPEGSED